MKWVGDHRLELQGFSVGAVVIGAIVLAMAVAADKPAKASPAMAPLTAQQQVWVVECAKYPGDTVTPRFVVLGCTERARILGGRGWL